MLDIKFVRDNIEEVQKNIEIIQNKLQVFKFIENGIKQLRVSPHF